MTSPRNDARQVMVVVMKSADERTGGGTQPGRRAHYPERLRSIGEVGNSDRHEDIYWRDHEPDRCLRGTNNQQSGRPGRGKGRDKCPHRIYAQPVRNIVSGPRCP